jgi:predicted DNA-binding transcriptional regulator YafY
MVLIKFKNNQENPILLLQHAHNHSITNTLNDQAKIQRTLRLLMLLAGKRWYSAAEVEERIGISHRTLYRYLHTLEHAGFVVERQPAGYRLAAGSSSLHAAKKLLHFTEEEALLLYKTLGMLQGEGPARVAS